MQTYTYAHQTAWLKKADTWRPLIRMSVPLLPAVCCLLLLDVADSLLLIEQSFGLATMGLVLPFTHLMFALSVGASTAVVALMSRIIVQEDCASVRAAASSIFFMAFALAALIAATGYLIAESALQILYARIFSEETTALNKNINLLVLANYVKWRFVGFPLTLIIMTNIALVRAFARMDIAAYWICTWTLLTLGLDALFVKGFTINEKIFSVDFTFTFLPLGLSGLALGHLIADSIFLVASTLYLARKMRLFTWPKHFIFYSALFVRMVIPASLYQLFLPIFTTLIIALAATHGPSALSVTGTAMRLEPLLLLLPMSLSMSLPVFVAHLWHSGLRVHAKKIIRSTLAVVVFIQIAIGVLTTLLADTMVDYIFSENDEKRLFFVFLNLVPISLSALTIPILTSSIFNALGFVKYALCISALRCFFICLPSTFSGYWLYEIKGMFIGMAIGNLAIGIYSYFFLMHKINQQITLAKGNFT